MKHASTLTAATPLPASTDTANLLETSITGLEACFREVGEALAATIGTIDQMATGLADVRVALAPETAGAAVGRLRDVAHRLTTLPTLQRRRAVEVETLTGRTRELRAMLAEIGTILDLLGIYGINIKIVSSGEPAFLSFVSGMDRKLESGRREVVHITGEMDQFGKVIADVRKADRLLSDETARAGNSVPTELTANANALQLHVEGVVRTTDQVSGIVRTVQGEVARVLGAIQIGDSVRQRAEHCITMLRRLHAPDALLPAGAVAHMERLVEAHLRAMADEFQQEIAAIVESLDRVSPLAEELRGLIASQVGGKDGQILLQLEQGIAKLTAVMSQLGEADGQLASLTGFVGRTLADLTKGLTRIQNIAVDVQDISTNTRLLSRRHGDNGRAVAVIAKEVAPCASRLTQLGTAIGRQIDALTAIDLVQDGSTINSGTVLSDALAIVRNGCASSATAMSRGGEEAQHIIASLRSSAANLNDQRVFVQTLGAAADSLLLSAQTRSPDSEVRTPADEEALEELLPWAAKLYTMASERLIHTGFLLPGMVPPVTAAVAMSDFDDDDGLF
ncbi:hypothetical protein GGQ80_001094 [Sphingomonas jinjuensis]|uniref:Methyl-accepting chemotaxis protein n=1 Tax=Sphingomonas jinjuensis TaxID=535907 RepID=A0A840FA92_9SPHN|nr:hypothetical protein [Sphingomonas jinjuensis]MBB4153206.1 hypothetical protein [Sphingomonas jinjuensis]